VDVKAEHFERQVQRAEQERDMWEKKYEVRRNVFSRAEMMTAATKDAQAKARESKAELDELVATMEGL
jgi:tropomyosin